MDFKIFRYRATLLLWVVGMCFKSDAMAQSVEPVTASFEEFRGAVKEVLHRQPELQLEQSRNDELEQRRNEVAAQRLPQVRFGLENRTDIVSAERTAFDSGSRLDAVLTASQLLFDFGASGYKVASADLDIKAQSWQQVDVAGQLVFDIVAAYYDVARYQALDSLAIANVAEHLTLTEQVESRVAAGAGSRADLLKARSQWVAARSARVIIQGQLRQAEQVYAERFQANPTVISRPRPDFLNRVNEVSADSQLLANSPKYQSLKRQGESARLAALGANRDALPKLSLELQGRRFDVDDNALAENDLAVLVSVDYPLYSGGAQSARSRQASARLAQSEYQQQIALREITRLGQNAKISVVTKREEMELAVSSLKADRAVLDAYNSQFRIGRRGLTDLLDAQRDVFESGRQSVNAVFDHDLANYQLLRVYGALLPLFEASARSAMSDSRENQDD